MAKRSLRTHYVDQDPKLACVMVCLISGCAKVPTTLPALRRSFAGRALPPSAV